MADVVFNPMQVANPFHGANQGNIGAQPQNGGGRFGSFSVSSYLPDSFKSLVKSGGLALAERLPDVRVQERMVQDFAEQTLTKTVVGGLLGFAVNTGWDMLASIGVTAAPSASAAPLCDASWTQFKDLMLEKFGGATHLINSNGTDVISAIKEIAEDYPQLAEGARQYLVMASGTVRDGITSKWVPGQNISSPVNYAFDRGVNGALTNGEIVRDLAHFFQDEALLTGPVPDYIKAAMEGTCLPQNGWTVSCAQLTQRDFHHIIAEAIGDDTAIYNGAASTTSVMAKLETLKSTNRPMAEAIEQWQNDPEVFRAPPTVKDGVSTVTGRPVTTLMEYAKDGFEHNGKARTLAHVFWDEAHPDQQLRAYQVPSVRADCVPPTAALATNSFSSMAAAAFLGAGMPAIIGSGVIAGILYKCLHPSKTNVEHIRLEETRSGQYELSESQSGSRSNIVRT